MDKKSFIVFNMFVVMKIKKYEYMYGILLVVSNFVGLIICNFGVIFVFLSKIMVFMLVF